MVPLGEAPVRAGTNAGTPCPAPVTTVTSSPNPSTFGQNVTLTATASPADGGTITFSSGSQALCPAVPLTHLTGRTYQATCTTTALPAGRDTITAAYPGDASYAPSAGTLTQTVTRAPTALTARTRPGPHQAITVTAALTACGRPLSGQPVSFSTRHTRLCTPDTSSCGVATCALTPSQARQARQDHDTIRASYPETPATSHHQRPRPCRDGGPEFSHERERHPGSASAFTGRYGRRRGEPRQAAQAGRPRTSAPPPS